MHGVARTDRRLLRRYAYQNLHDGWTMPGFSLERSLQLIRDSLNLFHDPWLSPDELPSAPSDSNSARKSSRST
jgi:hypothetical protein